MRRAFTAVELAICLSILAILVPLVYAAARGVEDNHQIGLWHLKTAQEVRSLADAMRADQRQGQPVDGESLSWKLGACTVRYRLDPVGAVLREAPSACGGSAALAAGVEALEPQPGGVEITFLRHLRPTREERSTVFIPLGVTP